MAKQTFTTGQVLTAAQMTSLQQTAMGGGSATAKTASYVLVAADAGGTVAMNAAGATTITVNTSLFAAGDTVFIQNLGAGACTVTAGTATVATAGSLILPQNDAGILYFTATGASIFYDYIQTGAASPLTTKGDLYTYSTSDARLAVGTNTHVLTADSAEATGLKWAAASSGSRGLNQIIPTSVNVGSGSASVGANGKVTVTGVNTNMSINGVFSSTYTNYKVLFNLKTASSYVGMTMRFRVAGVDNTTASSYKFNVVQAQGTNFGSTAATSDKFTLIDFVASDSACGGEINFYDPFLVTQTSISQNSSVGFAAGDLYNIISSGTQTGAISFDGFSFLISTAITGSILIYGWSE